jgi:Arc/MetJ family transcription regulator
MNGPVHVYGWSVRTNIEIDDELLAEAQALAGTRTKKATVEFALAELIRRRRAKSLLQLRGAVAFDIDLDESRRGRP